MKTSYLIGLLAVTSFCTRAQTAKSSFVASVSGEDRKALAKTAIHLTEFHEKSFWTQYENYMNKGQELSSQVYDAVAAIATSDPSLGEKQSIANARLMIYYRYEQLVLWQKYYAEIGSAHNGVIALQFLQTEVLLDMLESARVYEQTELKKYRFHPHEDSITKLPVDKHKILSAAILLPSSKEEAFFKVYGRYEHECIDLLGEDYTLIANYAAEPSDFAPGQAQLLGFNLLETFRREIMLKEKYYAEMNSAVGASLATRFLAWEDYYSLVSKLDAWADAP
jgi:hypothetical protein